MKKILLIEDDIKICRILELKLRNENYLFDIANDGNTGYSLVLKNEYHIILLDLMLPKISGEDLCKKIRTVSNVPIMVISAKSSTLSKINLFDIGADDYMTKPFDIDELIARIKVLLRNKAEFSTSSFISYSDIRIDLKETRVFINDLEIKLSKTEYDLLYYLMLNREIVLSRETILSNVWGYDYIGNEKIVDVYISYLRAKIENTEKKYINTIRGFGYILKEEKIEKNL